MLMNTASNCADPKDEDKTRLLLRCRGLSLMRMGQIIFRRLDLDLHAGEAVHIHGENGSGKTSLLQSLAQLLPVDKGSIERQTDLMYLGHVSGVKNELSVYENLQCAAVLYHHLPADSALLEAALQHIGLARHQNRLCKNLSAGQKRRCQLARLWLPSPPLWLLDEPFTALDQACIAALETRLAEHLAQGGALLITSHQNFTLPGLASQVLRRFSMDAHG